MQTSETRTADFVRARAEELSELIRFEKSYYEEFGVKRGLRNPDGTGVMAGMTRLGNVRGYYMQDGERVAAPGVLTYRGIDLAKLVNGFLTEGRPGFEEVSYLLLFGRLPSRGELEEFCTILASYRALPHGFTEDMILAAPSRNIMNKLSRSVLALYSYDPDPETFGRELTLEIDKALRLTARAPIIVAYAYGAKRHYFENQSLHLRRPDPALTTAENFLRLVLRTGEYTPEEARLLDLCLVLHAEHGGGNNSAFACRVLSSAGTDIYSAISAAAGSLKGPLHGGANERVMDMLEHIGRGVRDWSDDDELRAYLRKILDGEAGAGDGKLYGMGHAIYTLSDPRALLLRETARELAAAKDLGAEFGLIESVERLAPEVFGETGRPKTLCANVDLYSGFVYRMLGIPRELYTPLFAVSRVPGWCAHRQEELWGSEKIIRPAYKAIAPETEYIALDAR
ncbi:MAG: citrate synthase [Oscillospiraceae bacterium]|jgi:citrate synthase|nr:citrate synthase [Oscillospiraceae bacterium]